MIPVNSMLLDGNEEKYLVECIRSGWISSEGPFVKRLEEEFSAKMNRKFGIAVSSGSAALDLAVAVMGLGPGDEVILPSFTIISCAAAILRAGAKIVPVDCDADTWNTTPNLIEQAITERTRAIMPVHLYGLPCDLNPILELAEKYDLKVIEDAAEMHGQTYFAKPCGSFGDVSTFSFYANKHVTTGEGGMLLTDDEELAEKARSFRNLCFGSSDRFKHEAIGWNFRMTNLQAAVGVAQLERLDEFVKRKRQIGQKYQEGLRSLPGLQLPIERTSYAENIYWVFGIVLSEAFPISRSELCQELQEAGIQTRPFFWPIHRQPALLKKALVKNRILPNCEGLGQRGFYIPSGVGLKPSEQQHVIDEFVKVYERVYR